MVACLDVDVWDATDGGRAGTHHQAEVALRQIDHGGVEVGALVEGGRDNRGREGRRGLYKTHMSAPVRSRDHQHSCSCHAWVVSIDAGPHRRIGRRYNLSGGGMYPEEGSWAGAGSWSWGAHTPAYMAKRILTTVRPPGLRGFGCVVW